MLTRRGAALAALLVVAGVGITAGTPAFADTSGTTLYVNNNSGANCSDSAPDAGTQAQPYCTVQAAVNAVSAGQTVQLMPGGYHESVDLTRSGTADAPITIVGTPGAYVEGEGYSLRVSGASNIVIASMEFSSSEDSNGAAVVIDHSHNVTVQHSSLDLGAGTPGEGTEIHVTGASTGVDIADNEFDGAGGSAVVLDGGGTGDMVRTNYIETPAGEGISVDSVPGADIVSNTIVLTCGSGIALTGTATGATIENNIVSRIQSPGNTSCSAPAVPPHGIEVGPGSVSGTIENYNDVDTDSASVADYAWGGTEYTTAAALNAATGQAGTDSNAPTLVDNSRPQENSPAIDSADASAPGEQAQDLAGRPRQDDPLVADSGTGAAGYYDRGASERQDTIVFDPSGYPRFTGPEPDRPLLQAPVGAQLTIRTGATSEWGGTLTYRYAFDDGSPVVTNTTGVTTHTYATIGNHSVLIEVTSSYGTKSGASSPIKIVGATPSPVITVSPAGDMTINASAAKSTDPWGVYGAVIDFGDGQSEDVRNNTYLTVKHTYAKPGTYTVTATLDDPGLDNAQATTTYTTNGSDFTAYGPTRVLDTRNGIGTGGVIGPVGAKQSIQVPIGGTGTIPADATAVALNVTETDAKGGGYITAYPTGGTQPATSNLDYDPGQTKAANVIVKLGTNGEITLTNTSSDTVSLIADVTGYFTKTNAAGYEAVAPNRVLDTRKGLGLAGSKPAKVGANTSIRVTVTAGRPDASEVKAVVLNLTATNTTGDGYVTAYPDGAARPVASSLDYPAGHTIANTVIVPVSANGQIDLYNASATPVDLIADVEGYFSDDPAADGAFVPVTPTRLYDSRKSAPLAASRTAILTPSALDTQDEVLGDGTAYVYNLTVTQPATGGYFTVYPAATDRPTASNVDFDAGETAANSVIAASTVLDGAGADSFFNGSGGNAQFIVDLFGYFADH